MAIEAVCVSVGNLTAVLDGRTGHGPDADRLAPVEEELWPRGFVGEWEIREQLQKFYAKVQTATVD